MCIDGIASTTIVVMITTIGGVIGRLIRDVMTILPMMLITPLAGGAITLTIATMTVLDLGAWTPMSPPVGVRYHNSNNVHRNQGVLCGNEKYLQGCGLTCSRGTPMSRGGQGG